MTGRLYLRLSIMREKDVLKKYRDDYHGILVEAHVLETFKRSVSAFIQSLDKPYIIDPITYKLVLDTIDEHIEKDWYTTIVEAYDRTQTLFEGTEKIERRILEDKKKLNRMVDDVIDYQRTRIIKLARAPNLLQYIGEETRPLNPPEILIPPYFVPDPEWLNINLESAKIALSKKKKNEKVYPMVVVDKDILFFSDKVNHIIDTYSSIEADGYFLWVTNFRENYEDSSILARMGEFASSLKKKSGGLPIINMYAGYFSAILMSKGILDGLVHGIGIAEYRDPYSVSGPAPARYYLPLVHSMVTTDLADDLNQISDSFRCGCQTCSRFKLKSQMNINDLYEHFMDIKLSEFKEANKMVPQNLISKIEKEVNMLELIGKELGNRTLLNPYIRTLHAWIEATQNLN